MESAKIEWRGNSPFGFIVFTLSAVIILAIFGCQKKHDNPSVALSSLTGDVLHHNIEIQSGIVYLKKDAVEFPGHSPNQYDDSLRFLNPPSVFSFENITAGNYYLYCKGYDYYFQDSVFGGIPVHVKSGESKYVVLAVTE